MNPPPRNPESQTVVQGLSQAEARRRLLAEGPNELPGQSRRSLAALVFDVAREPMFFLLWAAGVIYLLLGDISDALMLMGFVGVVLSISIYQEFKTGRVLEALRDLTSPRAQVVRAGIAQRIAGREVVRGDLLMLAEGDRVPADAVLVSCNDFAADESLLTGESAPVRKIASESHDVELPLPDPGGDDLPFIYAGTLVVHGQGAAQVLATGFHTAMGKIGKSLHPPETALTPLQKEVGKLIRVLAVAGVFLSVMLTAVYGISRGDWLHGLLAGITLAMSILPEEYPLVLTVFLAMGAWRISRHQVLTRRMPVIEALGSTTVLCVDKTGTLTHNRMTVRQLIVDDAALEVDASQTVLPDAFHDLVEFAILASEARPFDPMEKAIHALGDHYLSGTEHLHRDWTLEHEYALTPELLAHSHVWRGRGDHKSYVVATKGAPEAIADLCHLDARQSAALDAKVGLLAAQGMRILGVAKAAYSGNKWPDIQHDFDFEFVGLIGLADPVRSAATPAIRECATAGIRVVMITGDYPATAGAIARQINLDAGPGGIMTGSEFGRLGHAALLERIRHSNIFARMAPEQKLNLVRALKANGEIVAMTGDGVNDAPALRAAHIGIAMGGRGTDVAREAAALVLLDDDFSSIVRAIRLGRGIFHNLRKAMAYILAAHIPIAGLSLIPPLLGWAQIFSPVHIVFLEMIINPACSFAFEAERPESNVMRQPPRNPNEALFGKPVIAISLLQGMMVLLAGLGILAYAMRTGASDEEARALTFFTLVIGHLGLIHVNRSWTQGFFSLFSSSNPAVWWVTLSASVFILLAMTVPFLQSIFHFAPIPPGQFALGAVAGLASVLWFELIKAARRR